MTEKMIPSWRLCAIYHHSSLGVCVRVFLSLACLGLSATPVRASTYGLGANALLIGPAAGNGSVVLAVAPANATWTAAANAAWLHLNAENNSGTGSTNVVFSCDANTGATRFGTLTIAGLVLTVTQAGSTYFPADPLTTLVTSGLSFPSDVAVDGAGNVYIADSGNHAIKKWIASDNSVTTLVFSGLNGPSGVAVDGSGNVYIADTGDNRIKEWMPANSNLSVLVLFGFNQPQGVAVDANGNVFIADTYNFAVEEWSVTNGLVTTLVSSGLVYPVAVAVDGAGNVYIDDADNNVIDQWTAASSNVTTLVSGLNDPDGVAVDGAGNVYIANSGSSEIEKWSATNGAVTTLVSGLSAGGMALDGTGNLYFVNADNNTVEELPYAFVDPTAKSESAVAGQDVLPVVLPTTENLLGPFSPTSDQQWLTINGSTNGVVSFSFAANPGLGRTAYIKLLGQSIPVTQGAPIFSLGATARLEGPPAGSDSVVLAVIPHNGVWTAAANDSWLHLNTANQSGTGSADVIFSYDANAGATRSGTLTVGGQTLTVIQAGSTYVAAGAVTALVSSDLNSPMGLAVDAAGNVYIGDSFNNAVKIWTASDSTLTTLVSSGLNLPQGVAVDATDNVFIADTFSSAIRMWSAANSNTITLVSSGLNLPGGVAVDGDGNVYIADTFNSAIKMWTIANSNITTLVSSGLSYPSGVAVDHAGNVYIADTHNQAIKMWTAANSNVTTLVSSGLLYPYGVAVDGAGNVYIADTHDQAIKVWTAANSNVTTLATLGLNEPGGVVVDGAENVYLADSGNNAIKELPYAFVNPTAKLEGVAAGADALPAVLPATENLLPPFAPISDQPWLVITSVTNGVVSFSFTATTSNRVANITVLGQTISVTQAQAAGVVPPILSSVQMFANGALQFIFANSSSNSFTILSATNLTLPLSNWTVVGIASNTASDVFQFISQSTTNDPQRFYRVRSP
jgi:DNA-binding beta-propeller fold protein YncE